MSKRYLLPLKTYFILCGFYRIESNNWWIRCVHSIWRYILIATTAITVVQILFELLTVDEFVLNIHGFLVMMAGGFLYNLWLLVNFYVTERDFTELLNLIDKTSECSTWSGIEVKNMENVERYSKITIIYCLTEAFLSMVAMAIYPLFNNTQRVLSLPVRFPYDWTKSPCFEMTISFQLLANLIGAVAFPASSLRFLCVCLHIKGQFNILGCNIRNLIWKVLLDLGCSPEEIKQFRNNHQSKRFREMLISKEFGEITAIRFRQLINFHESILKISKKLQKTTAAETLISLVILEFMLIFTTISLYTIGCKQVMQCVALIMYPVHVMVFSFMLSISGEFIINEVSNLEKNLYGSNWELCSEKIKKGIWMMTLRCRRGPKIHIGGYSQLNLQIFLAMVKSAISYIVFLKKVVDRN